MITAKDMQQAIEFPAMVQELAALYESGETYFVAWGTEDYKVLQTGCERHKIENPVKYEDYLDLALAYRLWKGDDYTTGLKRLPRSRRSTPPAFGTPPLTMPTTPVSC